MEDRRLAFRIPLLARVRVMDPYTKRVVTSEATIRNLSKFGFSIISPDSVTRGVQYQFDVELPTGRITIQGKVVHLKIETPVYLCGVRIEMIPLLARSRFNRFLASQSRRLRQEFLVNSVVVGILVGSAVWYFTAAKWVGGILALVGTSAAIFFWMPF